jgi:hypothetical protein
MNKKDYRIAKGKIATFILKEIDNSNFFDEDIAKMLIEISLTYLNSDKETED